MNNGTRRIISISLGFALILGGYLGARYFVKNKPQAERRKPMSSMVPVVETTKLTITDQPLYIDCLGTVQADKTAAIQSEVNGRIVAVNENLVEGEQVKKGDLLIEIESVDYELALAKAEANLLTAKSNFRIEEGQQDVVRHELELMGGDESDAYRDLMLREPQLKSAEADVKTAELAVKSAQLDLERTRIRAPFDAVIVSTDADEGDYAQTSKTLIELASTDRYYIRAAVPLSALEPLPKLKNQPYPAVVTLSDGSSREARTHRLLPDLTDKGRMARILLIVESPYSADTARPLLLNEYVRVRIQGETERNASLIPRRDLRDGNTIWMIDADKKLRILSVEVLQGYTNETLIRADIEPGMKLVTTDLTAAFEGMLLREVGDPIPKQTPDPAKKANP